MACASRKKEQQISCCKVFLNGRVPPHVQANITKEMLKYLIFQRNQIPMAFEQLKFEYQRQTVAPNSSVTEHSHEKGQPQGQSVLPSIVHKRLGQLITSVEDHLSNIDTVFTSFSRVPRVLVLFGATVVSPKEVHEIVFMNQASVLDASQTDLRTKHCVHTLMRTLISDSSIWDAEQLPLTNTLVLIYAHRNSGLTWFKPKISFKVPTKGQWYSCKIHCGGIDNDDNCHDDCKHGKGEQARLGNCPIGSDDDYIWFQAPAPIKALQALTWKETSANDFRA